MADPTGGQNELPTDLPWWPVPRGRAVSAPNQRAAKVHCSVLLWHRSCKHTHMRANAHAGARTRTLVTGADANAGAHAAPSAPSSQPVDPVRNRRRVVGPQLSGTIRGY